jgi:hypothetical protein
MLGHTVSVDQSVEWDRNAVLVYHDRKVVTPESPVDPSGIRLWSAYWTRAYRTELRAIAELRMRDFRWTPSGTPAAAAVAMDRLCGAPLYVFAGAQSAVINEAIRTRVTFCVLSSLPHLSLSHPLSVCITLSPRAHISNLTTSHSSLWQKP